MWPPDHNHSFHSHLNQSADSPAGAKGLTHANGAKKERDTATEISPPPKIQFKVNNFQQAQSVTSKPASIEQPSEFTSIPFAESEQGMKKASQRFVQREQDLLEGRLAEKLESEQIEVLLDAHERNLADARSFSGLVRKLSRETRVAVGIIIFCLFTSSIYAGLGYWWMQSGGVSMAAELKKAVQKSPAFGLFKNIEQLQDETLRSPVKEKASPNPIMVEPEPINMLAQASKPSQKNFTMEELAQDKTDPTGRPDPFSPLVKEDDKNDTTPTSGPEQKETLSLIHFTGFVKDSNSDDKVAILKVYDPIQNVVSTYVKKPGEAFMVNGAKVVLKRIDMQGVQLLLPEGLRNLALYPFEDSTGTFANDTSAPKSDPQLP